MRLLNILGIDSSKSKPGHWPGDRYGSQMSELPVPKLLIAAVLGWVAGSAGIGVADGQPLDRGSQAVPLDGAKCDAWEIDYQLIGGTRLRVSETTMGAGDGTYDVGPGEVKLRFGDEGGKPAAGAVELLKLEVVTKFTVESKVVGLKTTVRTDAVAKNTPGKCGVIARGTLTGNRVTWQGSAEGYRSDGKLFCEGVMCGKMGAPPAGESPVKMGPYPVHYQPFSFGADLKRFTMPFSEVARSARPKQVTHLELTAVETRRRCVRRPVCK